jgi:creatinine amidohydrolase/Fe(II)-dependent formamide hydrolase-like protein
MVRPGRLRPDSWPAGASGVSGDPTRSSAELGQAGVEIIVTRTVDAVRKSIARR